MVNAMHWTPWPRTRLPVPALCLMVTATLAMACSPQEDSEATASMEDAAEPAPQTTPDAGAEVPGDKLSGVEVPEGEAATAGRLVDTAGAPIEGLRVLCCSSETCLIDTTDADGVYLHIGIVPTHRYKMQVTDAGGTYSDLIYYQPYVVDQLSVMEVDVIVPVIESEYTDWPAETGGTVTLAGGELELTAAPGALDYPLGKPEQLLAERVPAAQLPPYVPAPWAGLEEGAIAYVFTPATVEVESPAALRIILPEAPAEGTNYALWNADSHTGDMVAAGNASVDAEGAIVTGDASGIGYFSTLVLVPSQ